MSQPVDVTAILADIQEQLDDLAAAVQRQQATIDQLLRDRRRS